MALYTRYDQVGVKEDVSDIITMITPTATPFQTLIGTEKVKQTLFQWHEDALRAVALNAQIDGFTAASATLTAPTARTNYTQILEKTIQVSGTADTVALHGRNKETAHQLAKAAKELKRELEYSMVGTAQTAVAGNAATARKFAGYQAQILAGNISANGGTPRALTETLILTVDQAIYDAGSEADVIMVKPADSLVISNFAKVGATIGRTINDGATKLVNVVDVYVSPFGEKKVVLNRFQRTSDALIFASDMWKTMVLRPWSKELLAKTGDNESHLIVGEYSLKHLNTGASGLISDLS